MKFSFLLGQLTDIGARKSIAPFIFNSTGISPNCAKLSTIRSNKNILCPCFLVSSQDAATVIATNLSVCSSVLFVDIEKKIEFLSFNGQLQLGNIFSNVHELDLPCEVYPVKANDITVDAIYAHIVSFFGDIAGLNIGVIGASNIGVKISQRLVESGTFVNLFSRDYDHATSVCSFINQSKSSFTLASASSVTAVDSLFYFADCVIFSGDSKVALSEFAVNCILRTPAKTRLLLQVGHNIFSDREVSLISDADPFLLQRLDISTEILRFAESYLHIRRKSAAIASLLASKSVYASHGFTPSSVVNASIVNDVGDPLALIRASKLSDAEYRSFDFHSGELEFDV